MAYHKPDEEKENPFINNSNLVIIPVIASFSTDGKMISIYFSVKGIKIKIDKVEYSVRYVSAVRCSGNRLADCIL